VENTGKYKMENQHRSPLRWGTIRTRLFVAALLLSCSFIAGCAGGPSQTVTNGVINVVAAESFWGSIAAQLGGTHAKVVSIVSDPAVDPHEYETSTADAKALAQADYVIVNGAGYDTWAEKMLDANPAKGRTMLDVSEVVGKKPGDNPHFWYNPDYVEQVIARITRDYQSIDPNDAGYFALQKAALEESLAQYHQLVSSIRQTYSGVKVGSTESIFVYMAGSLGLDLISPTAFMNAISQGTDPPAQSVVQFQQQITGKQLALLVFNRQTVTAIATNLRQTAADNGIAMVGVTETVVPAGSTFQAWQVSQLQALLDALKAGR
jgi:zinc/manganese transport system substrate-binding protein